MMLRAFWFNFLGEIQVKKAKKFPQNTVGSMYHYGVAKMHFKRALDIVKYEREKSRKFKGWIDKWVK